MSKVSDEEIFTRVVKCVAEVSGFDAKEITNESRFEEDLQLDSLDTVELVMRLEDEFGIDIPDERAEKIKTVYNAVSWLQVKLNHK